MGWFLKTILTPRLRCCPSEWVKSGKPHKHQESGANFLEEPWAKWPWFPGRPGHHILGNVSAPTHLDPINQLICWHASLAAQGLAGEAYLARLNWAGPLGLPLMQGPLQRDLGRNLFGMGSQDLSQRFI